MGKKRDAAPAETAEPETSKPKMSKVMYIGHLPHGFYEKQLKGFFSQFGQVTRLKVSRNKKTAKAKHYAFLEFRTPEVAQIAADAMDGYMLFTQKLDCRALPISEVHKDVFKGANRAFKKVPWKAIEIKRHDGNRTEEQQKLRMERAISRDRKRHELLKAKMNYTYTPLGASSEKTHTKEDSGKGSKAVDGQKKLKKAKKAKVKAIS